jgi:copper chaperone CopZ
MNTANNNISKALFALIMVFMVACAENTSSEQSAESSEVPVTYVKESGESESYVANIAIDGMGCEMACGSKISGELTQLAGVKNISIDFKGAGETNYALVEYDAAAVSEQEMIKTVHSIADGHYKVNAVEVKHIVKSTNDEVVEDEDKSAFQPSISYELPNIFSVFSALF